MKRLIPFIMILFFINVNNSFAIVEQYERNDYLHLSGISIGSVTIFGDYTALALDVNYEFKQNKWNYGFGVFGEFALGKSTEFLTGFSIFVHDAFTPNLYFCFAPGIGFIDNLHYMEYKGDGTGHSNNEMTLFNNGVRANMLWRFGTGYEFIITSNGQPIMIATPNLNFDIISSYKTYMTFALKLNYIIK
jgi:hypothetical protein